MREGALADRILPDGREVVLYPLLWGNCRLLVGEPHSEVAHDEWHYEHVEVAAKAMHDWDGTGEPSGWFRHPASGRRRPGGDESKEYVQW